MRLLIALCLGPLSLFLFTGQPFAADKGAMMAPGQGLLSVAVMRGPVYPVERPGQPSSMPAAGVTIAVMSSEGEKIASVVTDSEGRCSVSLSPGTYHIEVERTPLGLPKGVPSEVTVSDGKETSLTIRLDTGIR